MGSSGPSGQEGEGAGRRWSARASARVSGCGRDRDAARAGPQLPTRLRHHLNDSRVSRLGG
eukprot:7590574-Pyramimonas_sp.AAC.1